MLRWRVETQVLAGFVLAVIVLAIIGGSLYRTTARFIATSEALDRSQRAVNILESIYSLLNQAESRQRAWLLLGDDVELDTRADVLVRVDALLDELETLTAGMPASQARLPALRTGIAIRLRMLDAVLDAYRHEGAEAGRRQLAAGPGRAEMERVLAMIVAMQAELGHQIAAERRSTERSATHTLSMLGLLLLLVAAALAALYAGIHRETRERLASEERRQSLIAELRSANGELENFAYVVSHDLKAPLRGIGSLADWLLADYTAALDEQGREYLGLMKNRVLRMDALIDGILAYSRVGRTAQTHSPVDLSALVNQTLQLLAPPPGITVDIEGELPVVAVDPTRMQQVLQNLIGNAIAHRDKPQCRIRIYCTDLGEQWQISIADDGPGIEARHHERIFQLFQVLAPRDRKESTGVGLALVRKIIELHGGRIWVESQPGAGATFHFTLPKSATPAARGGHDA